MKIKENLRDMLEYNDMSIAELARQTNIPLRSMQNYLYARSSMPPADYACRIARVLHTTVEELVGEGSAVTPEVLQNYIDKNVNMFYKYK